MSRQDSFIKVTGGVLLTSALLTGCGSSGYYQDRKTDYVDETTHKALELPETTDKARYRELMPLPEVALQRRIDAEFVTPRPAPMPATEEDLPPAELAFYEGGDTIEPRLWLSLSDRPAVAWPLLQQQFQQLGWTVKKADPATGRLQFVTRNSASGQVVNARLRQAVRGSFSDLELLTSQGDVRTDNAARTVLNQLKEGISAPRSVQSVSLLAQNLSRNNYMQLDETPGQAPALVLNADADRTWITMEQLLNKHLDDTEQKVLQSDLQNRTFSLLWVPSQDQKSSATVLISSFLDYILSETGDLQSSFGLSRKAVILKLSGDQPVRMTVEQEDGQPVDEKKALFILGEVQRLLN